MRIRKVNKSELLSISCDPVVAVPVAVVAHGWRFTSVFLLCFLLRQSVWSERKRDTAWFVVCGPHGVESQTQKSNVSTLLCFPASCQQSLIFDVWFVVPSIRF